MKDVKKTLNDGYPISCIAMLPYGQIVSGSQDISEEEYGLNKPDKGKLRFWY